MAKLSKIKEALQKMLMQFSQLSTSKGLITWSGDGEYPEIGDSIMVIDEEGNESVAENGEYVADNGTIIVVEDGKVVEVREKENTPAEEPAEEPQEQPEDEPQPEEEPAEEPQNEPENEPENKPAEEPAEEPAEAPQEGDDKDEQIRNLEAEVARLEEENGALKERIRELEEKSAADPANEEFERINRIEKTGNAKLDKLNKILNAKF